MKEHIKYTDIIRLGHKSTEGVLKVGDIITITEKLDGSNASFCLDDEGEVMCFSRNTILDQSNTLNGFYNWVQMVIVPIKHKLMFNVRYFGEWLVPHKVKYLPEAYKDFYLFSVYDEHAGEYGTNESVLEQAVHLGLQTPELFYFGEYKSFEHLMSFVGKSNLTLEPNTGEGIVVKNPKFIDKYGRQLFVKLVSEAFAEIQQQKLPKDPSANDVINSLVASVVTVPRVDKLIRKAIDFQELPSQLGIEDMKVLLDYLRPTVYTDIMKEESHLLSAYEEDALIRAVGKVLPNCIKEVLKSF